MALSVKIRQTPIQMASSPPTTRTTLTRRPRWWWTLNSKPRWTCQEQPPTMLATATPPESCSRLWAMTTILTAFSISKIMKGSTICTQRRNQYWINRITLRLSMQSSIQMSTIARSSKWSQISRPRTVGARTWLAAQNRADCTSFAIRKFSRITMTTTCPMKSQSGKSATITCVREQLFKTA